MHIFDDLSRNHACPLTPLGMQQVQAAIDHIAGRTLAGMSNLRLVWGCDRESARILVDGKWQGRYLVEMKRELELVQWGSVGLQVPHVDRTEILLPRFVVEQLCFPRVSREDWDADRFRWIDDVLTDFRGPYPEHGFYRMWHLVAEHDARCCSGREIKNNNRVCHGFYRPFSDFDLEVIAYAIQEREQRRKFRALDARETEAELADAARVIRERQANYWREIHQGFFEAYEAFESTHGWRALTHDPSVLQNGRWHFLSGHNKSGTPGAPAKEHNASSIHS